MGVRKFIKLLIESFLNNLLIFLSRFLYPACAGSSQSPIDLVPSSAVYDASIVNIEFNDYDAPYDFNLYYNGHVLQMLPYASLSDSALVPSISGSDYGDTFKFAQFHFHWGKFFIFQSLC
jgi:carbonic anhydrase